MRVVLLTASTAFAVVLGVVRPAASQGLTLEEVIARARTRAPDVVAAVSRVEEARARLLGASVRFRDNPAVDFDIGPRRHVGAQTWDFSVGVSQVFETGGQRAARIAAAEAEIQAVQALADESGRVIARDVAAAYLRAVAASERVRLLQAAEGVAEDLRSATQRRFQAGDVASLDVNLTIIAAARARSDRMRAEAERADALRPIRLALGMDAASEIALASSLERQPLDLASLRTAIARTPAIQRADADLAQARAAVRLGAAMKRPDIAPRVSVSREQDDRILLGGLSITLPTFERGQAVSAEADARIQRLTQERSATLRALELEVAAGLTSFAQKRAAVDVLRDTALPAATDNESLASRSLDAGEINLLNFLLVRQDVTTVRLSYVDAQLDAALAAIDVDAAAGALP